MTERRDTIPSPPPAEPQESRVCPLCGGIGVATKDDELMYRLASCLPHDSDPPPEAA